MLSARVGHDYSFYNLSQHNLKTVANDPDTLEQNLRSYINQFSENVRDIFEKYKFEDTIADLAAHNLLYQVIQHFSRGTWTTSSSPAAAWKSRGKKRI